MTILGLLAIECRRIACLNEGREFRNVKRLDAVLLQNRHSVPTRAGRAVEKAGPHATYPRTIDLEHSQTKFSFVSNKCELIFKVVPMTISSNTT